MDGKTPGAEMWARLVSRRSLGAFVVLVLGLSGPGVGGQPGRAAGGARPKLHGTASAALAALPLYFEENRGQADDPARFIARSGGHAYLLTPEGVRVQVIGEKEHTPSTIGFKFAGGSPDTHLQGARPMPGRVNYLAGGDPSKWLKDLPAYERVLQSGVYPGVDLIYYGRDGELEFDLVVAPRADPQRIRLSFEGVDRIESTPTGDLVARRGGSHFRLRKPRAFQEVRGCATEVGVFFRKTAPLEMAFDIGSYDPSRALTIDPVLAYSTHLGGGGETGRAVAVNSDGNTFVVGETPSLNFPTTGAYQSRLGGQIDAFVVKLLADGSAFAYATYLGGSGDDRAAAVAVDRWGAAYVSGSTRSTNFPTRNAYQSRLSGGSYADAFVTKLSSSGSELLYSTYFGGSDEESADGIAVGSDGSAAIIGTTRSLNLPVRSPLQSFSGGAPDAFVAKLGPDGTQLLFSTYLGGSVADYGHGIALDGAGNGCVTGTTLSSDFPLRHAFQSTLVGGSSPFVARFSTSGEGYVYSTYLGNGEGNAIAADAAGNVYVTGQAGSARFPLVNAFQSSYGGGIGDAFVTKMNPSGSSLLFSTYLGGNNVDAGRSIALDVAGGIYVAGETSSVNFPAKNPLQPALRGSQDAFLTRFDPTGSKVAFSSWFGGSGIDAAYGVAVDGMGNASMAGATYSVDFPVLKAIKSVLTSYVDAFVLKVAPDQPLASFLYFPQVAIGGGYSTVFTVTNTGAADAAGTLSLTDSRGLPMNAGFALGSAQGGVKEPGDGKSAITPSVSLTVPSGGTLKVTATSPETTDPVRNGWASLESSGGLLAGVATFLLSDRGKLKSLAGVLTSPLVNAATIPVDNNEDRQRFTGFAVANPSSGSVAIKLVTLDQNGKLLETVYIPELNPMSGQTQVSRFLHEIVPARLNFRGSMVLAAESDSRFAAVALVQDGGLLTAIPVVAGKPPGI